MANLCHAASKLYEDICTKSKIAMVNESGVTVDVVDCVCSMSDQLSKKMYVCESTRSIVIWLILVQKMYCHLKNTRVKLDLYWSE